MVLDVAFVSHPELGASLVISPKKTVLLFAAALLALLVTAGVLFWKAVRLARSRLSRPARYHGTACDKGTRASGKGRAGGDANPGRCGDMAALLRHTSEMEELSSEKEQLSAA